MEPLREHGGFIRLATDSTKLMAYGNAFMIGSRTFAVDNAGKNAMKTVRENFNKAVKEIRGTTEEDSFVKYGRKFDVLLRADEERAAKLTSLIKAQMLPGASLSIVEKINGEYHIPSVLDVTSSAVFQPSKSKTTRT